MEQATPDSTVASEAQRPKAKSLEEVRLDAATTALLQAPNSAPVDRRALVAYSTWLDMERRLCDPALTDADRETLAARLRRDLRVDALHTLAFRATEAWEASAAEDEALVGALVPARRAYRNEAVSQDLHVAMEAHREAVQLAIHDPVADCERREASQARIRKLADALRAVPARSLADLRHKVIYLWPGNVEGEVVSEDLSETFLSFNQDLMQLTDTVDLHQSPDPIVAAIQAARIANAAKNDFYGRFEGKSLGEEGFQEEFRLIEISSAADEVVFSTVPTTRAGQLALIEFIRAQVVAHGMANGDPPDDESPVWRDAYRALMAALAAPIAPPVSEPLADAILDGWAAWGATCEAINEDDNHATAAAWDRASERRNELLDAAEALPASPQAISAKALACAWMEWVSVERPGQARDKYTFADRIVFDLHSAIMARSSESGIGTALKAADHAAALTVTSAAADYDLSALTLAQLGRLYETILFTERGLSSHLNCPFSWDGARENYSGVGDIISAEAERWSDLIEAVVEEATSRAVKDDGERDERLEILAGDAMRRNGPIADKALVSEIAAAWGA